ncbi:MAG: glycosyl transferase family 2, partial [Halanaeroarchaeum sp.]
EVFETSGFRESAQVDLGRYEHDHRAVTGPGGLTSMAAGVAGTILRVLEDGGVEPAYGTLRERYRATAERFVEQYRADARFNGFTFDESAERQQVAAYESAIGPPGDDDRLPAWEDAPVDPETIRTAVDADLDRVQ